LDKAISDGQDGQTIGLPIGPDTSLVVAELLLASVDVELTRRMPRISAHRHVDDYELGTSSRNEAEDFLGFLQECLGRNELALNPDKTHIQDLPQLLEAPWAAELRTFQFRHAPVGQATDVIRVADRAFGLARDFPHDNVLGYALSRLRGVNLAPGNWPLLQALLFQATTTEPKILTIALEWLQTAALQAWPIDRDRLEEAVNSVIVSNAPAGHGNDVAWALWTCLVHRLQVHSEAAAALSKMTDSVVALLALDADGHQLISNLDKTHWAQFMTRDDLWGEQWLLSYEANVHGWLPSLGPGDHVDNEQHFAVLKRAGIRFYDSSGPLPAAPSWTWSPIFGLAGSILPIDLDEDDF